MVFDPNESDWIPESDEFPWSQWEPDAYHAGWVAARKELLARVRSAIEEDHHVNGLMCAVCSAACNPGGTVRHAEWCIGAE